MGQIVSGIRAVLSHPFVYDSFQNICGAHAARIKFANEVIRAKPGERVLDLGCGTAEILRYLPKEISYHGFDISEPYIRAARERYGTRGLFEVDILDPVKAARLPKFDVVLTIGVLHHLSDDEAKSLFATAQAALKPGGRFISADPCLVDGQNPIARLLIKKDRGQNVRSEAGYLEVAHGVFANAYSTIQHRSWIPYTHCYVQAINEQ